MGLNHCGYGCTIVTAPTLDVCFHVDTGKGYGSDVRTALESKDLVGGAAFLLHPQNNAGQVGEKGLPLPSLSQTVSAPGTGTHHECRRESRRGTFLGKV